MTLLIAWPIFVHLHTMVIAYIWATAMDVQADHRDLVRFFSEAGGGGGLHCFCTGEHGPPRDHPQYLSFCVQKCRRSSKAVAHQGYADEARRDVGLEFPNGACGWRLSGRITIYMCGFLRSCFFSNLS